MPKLLAIGFMIASMVAISAQESRLSIVFSCAAVVAVGWIPRKHDRRN
jgi:ABC-type hemin transport system ATPase subunit